MSAFSSGFSDGFGATAAEVKYWIGSTTSTSDDDTRWSLSSGGSNDTSAPIDEDSVIFDASGQGTCNWNSSVELSAYTEETGYLAKVTVIAGTILGITGDHALGADCGFVIVDTAQVNLDGNIVWDVDASIDLQFGSVFNTGGNLQIPNGNSYALSGTIIIAKDGGTVQVINPDNSSRIHQIQLTADSIIQQEAIFYADSVAGPASGLMQWQGTDTIISINPWTNKENILCEADTGGGITLSDAFASTVIGDYGNWVLTGSDKTITGSGVMECFRFDCFQLSQNTTVTTLIIGSFDFICNQGLKITDTNPQENRGGSFDWQSTGLLSIGFNGIICNDVDGIQSSEFLSAAGAGPITVVGGDISIGINCTIDLGAYANTITFDQSFIVDVSATSSTENAKLSLNGGNAQTLDIMSACDSIHIRKTAGYVELHEINCGVLVVEVKNDEAFNLNWNIVDSHSIDRVSVVGSGSGLVLFQSSLADTQANVSMSNNSTVFNADFKDMNFSGGVVFADSKTCTDLGGNTLSDGTTDGIFFTDIQYPVDNIYITDRITAVTIQRRGQTVPAITLSELFTGDDWAIEMTFKDGGNILDLSSVASIHAAVVSDGNIALIPSTLQSDSTAGADWDIGKVIVVFTAAVTSDVIPARNAWIEVQVTELGGNVYTFPREQIRIVKGVIS